MTRLPAAMRALSRSVVRTLTPRAAILIAGAVIAAAGAVAPAARAQRTEASEASVKAAFLYKFASYVEWPAQAFASPQAPFVIAVIGDDDVASELARMVPGHLLAGHPMAERTLNEGDPVEGVHLLFIGPNAANGRAETARAARARGVLVVTESRRGLELGSAINFVISDEHVGFEVSLPAAERSGLKVSSRMLSVARRVVQATP
jgi:uncharacterized protein DUF4154